MFAQVLVLHNGWTMEEHFRNRCFLFITLLSVTLSGSKERETEGKINLTGSAVHIAFALKLVGLHVETLI